MDHSVREGHGELRFGKRKIGPVSLHEAHIRLIEPVRIVVRPRQIDGDDWVRLVVSCEGSSRVGPDIEDRFLTLHIAELHEEVVAPLTPARHRFARRRPVEDRLPSVSGG